MNRFWHEFREWCRIVAAVGSLRECEGLLRVVFPHWDRVLVEQVRRVDGTVRVSARTRADSGFACPDCGVLSRRVHSRYRRLIADTAVGGQPVVIELSVRRLFCDEAGCPAVPSPSRSTA